MALGQLNIFIYRSHCYKTFQTLKYVWISTHRWKYMDLQPTRECPSHPRAPRGPDGVSDPRTRVLVHGGIWAASTGARDSAAAATALAWSGNVFKCEWKSDEIH